jgi:ABC-2 type transport system ATP-binding protein
MTGAAIVSRGLVRAFGRTRALDGFDLDVRGGEILGLIGPNGAGKSTFIRVVAGLLAPDEGSVSVLDRRPGRRVAANIGYMTQAPALYDDLSIRENLEFFGRIYGMQRADIRASADELLGLLTLTDKTDQPIRELSGGQRQLANLACALIHGPSIILLDEPTVGIDPVLRRSLWSYFAGLRTDGATIVVTTHVLEEADRCDRVAFVSDGRVTAVDPPDELRRRAGVHAMEDAYLAFRDARHGGDVP